VPAITITDDDLQHLRTRGFGLIVLQRPRGYLPWFQAAEAALTEQLGLPLGTDHGIGWVVWTIPASAPNAEAQGVPKAD
jgi:hypothetical protein